MKKISVVVPTYNRQLTIERCINSILNQTIPVEEIVIEQNRCAMACQGCDAVFLFLNKKAVETKS